MLSGRISKSIPVRRMRNGDARIRNWRTTESVVFYDTYVVCSYIQIRNSPILTLQSNRLFAFYKGTLSILRMKTKRLQLVQVQVVAFFMQKITSFGTKRQK